VPESRLTGVFQWVKPKHGLIVQLDRDGGLLSSCHDPTGATVSDVSQVSDDGRHLYLGSFHSAFIARIPA
jgi:hypothetical protein